MSLFFPVVLLGLTLSPSGDGMTVLVLVNAPLFGHICRIGRVVLSVEGGMVACVLNREGDIVAVFPGRAFGADVITLRGQNRPPGLVGMAGVLVVLPGLGGWCWRVFLLVMFIGLSLSPS